MKAEPRVNLYVDDPIFAPKNAARYLDIAPRTLRALRLNRSPMAGTGLKFGYRRSTLNQYLADQARRYGAFSASSQKDGTGAFGASSVSFDQSEEAVGGPFSGAGV